MILQEEIFDNDDEEFEEWEEDSYYLEKEDYPGLLKYRKEYAHRRPDDLYAQIRLGEAYNLVGDYQAAIDFCTKLHRQYQRYQTFSTSFCMPFLLLIVLKAISTGRGDRP